MLSDLANFCDFLTKIKSSATDTMEFCGKMFPNFARFQGIFLNEIAISDNMLK
jgi:hypothetical protein